jgi:hypothetical protein
MFATFMLANPDLEWMENNIPSMNVNKIGTVQ